MKYILFLSVCFLFNCSDKKKPQGESDFQKHLNAQFKDASISPLKESDLKNFSGLEFFNIDSSFIVKAYLIKSNDSSWISMRTTTDRMAEQRLFGVLNFNLKGKYYILNVFQPKDYLTTEGLEDQLFLPFLDDTNGESTYAGGRYIDLNYKSGDSLIIDFNKAYNPYCTYNEKYSCPIVPRANYLDVRVEAGVKKWKK